VSMRNDNGLGIFFTGLPARLAIDYAQRADMRGFRSAWFPEITFADSFGPATAALRTERSRSEQEWSESDTLELLGD
jgi:alkanesulfonate monooxygenase SsuD/methylene tetrahydromethanopterin reductase-like flavin-dependent oxidoreductase (luciferase family)